MASTCFAIEMTGVIPLPPQQATTGRSSGLGQNTPAGLVTSSSLPASTCSSNQPDISPPGTRFTVTVRSASMPGVLDME